MAKGYDKYNENPTKKNMSKGTPASGDWTGMNPDGESKNTFGPEPKSTPNKVEAEDTISRKDGKGRITGGVEEENIFGSIQYTGNTVDAAKPATKKSELNMSIFERVDRQKSFSPEGLPDNSKTDAIMPRNEAAMHKDKKVSGHIERDEGGSSDYIAPVNNSARRVLKSDTSGKNPTSQNVKISDNIFTK